MDIKEFFSSSLFETKFLIAGGANIIFIWSLVILFLFESLSFRDFLKYEAMIVVPTLFWLVVFILVGQRCRKKRRKAPSDV